MITTIYKLSPKERIRMKYGFNLPEYAEKELCKEMLGTIYYERLVELPKSCMKVGKDKDCELTKRIKYSRGARADGTKNKDVDIFIEISWKLSKVKPGGWFRANEYIYETRTTWIPAEAFEFDFSDEIDEEIIDCAN